ncbi:hypothetical protein AAKU67_001133 [Oxalobacteraceae bacterium GrIS 2.11]
MSSNSAFFFNFLFLFKSKYVTMRIGPAAIDQPGIYHAIDIGPEEPRQVPTLLTKCIRCGTEVLPSIFVKIGSAFFAGIGTSPFYVQYFAPGFAVLSASTILSAINAKMNRSCDRRFCLEMTAALLSYAVGLGGSILYHEAVYPWD